VLIYRERILTAVNVTTVGAAAIPKKNEDSTPNSTVARQSEP